MAGWDTDAHSLGCSGFGLHKLFAPQWGEADGSRQACAVLEWCTSR